MKILLVDNHGLFRDGISHFLRQSLDKVEEILQAENFSDGLKLAMEHSDLDLILLELKSPGSGGAISVKRLRYFCPHVPVVVVSIEDNRSIMNKALAYGASAYVCKSATSSTLLGALKAAYPGHLHVPEKLLRQPEVADLNRNPINDDRRSNADENGLTMRQKEVLRCLAAGYTNKEISEITGLALGTIKMHLTAVYKTLRVTNRTEAIWYAKELGLFDTQHALM